MAGKEVFASKVQEAAVRLAQTRDMIADLVQVYSDRAYDTSNPITDADVVNLGVTAAQINAFIPLGKKLKQLMQNQAIAAPINGDAILNVLRKDV